MNYQVTIFKNLKDSSVSQVMKFSSWEFFSEFMNSEFSLFKESKEDSGLISPAIFKESSSRKNENVILWGKLCFIDIDNHNKEKITEKKFNEILGSLNYKCLVYSTASSKKDEYKFRVVFPMEKILPSAHIKHFWRCLNSEMNGIIDQSCKDFARIYYLPGNYSGANNFMIHKNGEIIDPIEFMKKYPELSIAKCEIPREIKDKILRNKLDSFDREYKWVNYRDCPFVEKRRLNEYNSKSNIDGSGRYHALFSFMHSIASRAFVMGYKITANEIACLIEEIDRDNGYLARKKGRPLVREAENARAHALKHIPEFKKG